MKWPWHCGTASCVFAHTIPKVMHFNVWCHIRTQVTLLAFQYLTFKEMFPLILAASMLYLQPIMSEYCNEIAGDRLSLSLMLLVSNFGHTEKISTLLYISFIIIGKFEIKMMNFYLTHDKNLFLQICLELWFRGTQWNFLSVSVFSWLANRTKYILFYFRWCQNV